MQGPSGYWRWGCGRSRQRQAAPQRTTTFTTIAEALMRICGPPLRRRGSWLELYHPAAIITDAATEQKQEHAVCVLDM